MNLTREQRTVLAQISAEAPLASKLRTWSTRAGRRARFLNTYGPTETTIMATVHTLSPVETRGFAGNNIPIAGGR
jgi:nonribosomal peptide synthetase MxcG